MEISKILIIFFITLFFLYLYIIDTYTYGLGIFTFLVFILSVIIFFKLTYKSESGPKIRLKRIQKNERNILNDKNYLHQPRGIIRNYLNQEKDHPRLFRNKLALIDKVGPENVVTEYSLSNYETTPKEGQQILNFLRKGN